jgi:hypothetical protein
MRLPFESWFSGLKSKLRGGGDADGDDEQFWLHLAESADYNAMGAALVTIEDHEPPVASYNEYYTAEDTPVTGNVLFDDTGEGIDYDPNGGTITASGPTWGPTFGTVTINVDGSFTYIPSQNFCGMDYFGYGVYDSDGQYAESSVSITMNSINDPPVAYDSSLTLDEDTTYSGQTSGYDVDGDSLTASLAAGGQPSHGVVTIDSYGYFSYTPKQDFHGNDSFQFKMADPYGAVGTGTVSLTINPTNDYPVAVADGASTGENESVVISGFLANDYDVDGDAVSLSYFDSSSYSGGAISDNGDGTATYTPPTDYTGIDSFGYTITDPAGLYGYGTIYVNVNDAPVVWMWKCKPTTTKTATTSGCTWGQKTTTTHTTWSASPSLPSKTAKCPCRLTWYTSFRMTAPSQATYWMTTPGRARQQI